MASATEHKFQRRGSSGSRPDVAGQAKIVAATLKDPGVGIFDEIQRLHLEQRGTMEKTSLRLYDPTSQRGRLRARPRP